MYRHIYPDAYNPTKISVPVSEWEILLFVREDEWSLSAYTQM